jgi:hypothetical protein
MRHPITPCLLVLASLHALCSTTAASDPTTADCLSAYEQSIMLRNRHELRAARAELLVCVSPTCPEDVRNECARRVSDVSSQLPTLVFEAKDRAGNDIRAVSVSMDGHQLVETLEGTALSIDPGEHVFVFTAEGASPVEKRLVIREGEKDRREKVVVGPELLPTPPPPEPEPAVEPEVLPAPLVVLPVPTPLRVPEPDHTRRTAGIIVGAIGVVALGVALYEQVSAHNDYADSEHAARSGDEIERARTHSLYVDAKHAQTTAIVVGALGVVVLAPAAYLLLSSLGQTESPRATASVQQLTPWLAPSTAGLSYARQF